MKGIQRLGLLSLCRRPLSRPVFARSFSQAMEELDNTLIITKACAKRIKDLQKSSSNSALKLRIAVEGGGCSGFQYNFSMDDTQEDEEEDLIFSRDGSNVVVDESSFSLIKGSTIDYEQELIRSAFAVVNNPQSESACGCGSSFAIKNFSANPAND
jgi:iron-sulfur cluster assembly 2